MPGEWFTVQKRHSIHKKRSLFTPLPCIMNFPPCPGCRGVVGKVHTDTAAALLWGDFFTYKVKSRRAFPPGLSQCGETWSKKVRKPVN